MKNIRNDGEKVILITGSSSGIGLATMEQLVNEGHTVFGSVRNNKDAQIIESAGAIPLIIEMTNYESLEKAVNEIIKSQKRIDVLINNAGYGLYGSVEETAIKDAKLQFDVNLFGLARLTQLVLPYMREQKSGKIINISSMAGKIYTPLGAWYHATKYALEGWSDCLRIEVKDFGIRVVIIEPGVIKTPWSNVAADNIARISGYGPYKKIAKKTAKKIRKTYSNSANPSLPTVIAKVISEAIATTRPKTRYVAGKHAKQLIFIRKYLGDRFYDKLIKLNYKL